jgi:predicted RNase H-like nuclease (RuvC/YqgF family)
MTDKPQGEQEVRGQFFIDAAKRLEAQGKKLTINSICVEAGKTAGSFREERYPEAFRQVSYMFEKQNKHAIALNNRIEEKNRAVNALHVTETLLTEALNSNVFLQEQIVSSLHKERYLEAKLQEVTEARDRYKHQVEKLSKELRKWVPKGIVISLFGSDEHTVS